MPVNILCIGDVVGRPGRALLADHLERIVNEQKIECVICNAENAAGGSGVTPQIFKKLMRYGVDVVTLGDHAYKKLQLVPEMRSSDRIVRPANLAPVAAGREWTAVETKSGLHKVGVTCLLGQTFMRNCDSPWQKVDQVLDAMPKDAKMRVVDFHAEATSEKIAMGWHLNGRATIVFGTHTHVPTADARVLDGGTAYISDVGMTGPYDGVLGRRKDRVLHALTTSMPAPFEVARDDPRLCGIIVSADPDTGKAIGIERLEIKGRAVDGPIYDSDDAAKSGFYRD